MGIEILLNLRSLARKTKSGMSGRSMQTFCTVTAAASEKNLIPEHWIIGQVQPSDLEVDRETGFSLPVLTTAPEEVK